MHDATQCYARPSRFMIPCKQSSYSSSASVLNENLGARGLKRLVPVENLKGVHAVTSTTDFLRLFKLHLAGWLGQPPVIHPRHDRELGRGHWPLIFQELTRDRKRYDGRLVSLRGWECVMDRLVAAGLSHVDCSDNNRICGSVNPGGYSESREQRFSLTTACFHLLALVRALPDTQ